MTQELDCSDTWLLNEKEFSLSEDAKYMGFVYLITNLTNNRKYVGRKLFTFASTKQVKGKKKKIRVESDWQSYYGSSEELKADVEKLGTANFKREILYLCTTKGECNYLESREIFDRRCLEKPDEYYNGQVQCRIHRTHIKRVMERVRLGEIPS